MNKQNGSDSPSEYRPRLYPLNEPSGRYIPQPQDEQIDLMSIWNVLWFNKFVVALIATIILIGTTVVVMNMDSMYSSDATLLIKQERPDELELLNPLSESVGSRAENDAIDLEIELIRNAEAITQYVLQDLVQRPLTPDGNALPLFSKYLNPSEDNITDSLIIDRQTRPLVNTHLVSSGETLYSIARRYGMALDSIRAWNDLSTDIIESGQRVLVQAPTNITFHTVFDSLTMLEKERLVAELKQSLPEMIQVYKIQSGGRSNTDVNMIGVRSISSNRFQATRLVDSYVNQIIRHDKEMTTQNLQTAERYLSDLVNSRSVELQSRAAEINDLKKDDWELVTDETGELTTVELRQLENQLTEIEFQRELTVDIISRLEQEKEYALTMLANNQVNTTRNWIDYLSESILELQIRSEAYVVEDSLLLDDPTRNEEYSVIIDRINYLEQKKQEYQQQYVSNINEQQGLSEESVTDYILQLRREIEEQESNAQNLSQQAVFLQEEIQTIQAQYFGLLDRVLDLQLKQKQLGFSESLYESLLRRLQDTQYSLETQTDRFQVIQQASFPQEPISPNRPRFIMIGAILGFMLGGAYVLIRHALDDKIRTPQQIKDLGLNFLGLVPDLEDYFAYKRQNRSNTEKQNGAFSHDIAMGHESSDTDSDKASRMQDDVVCHLDPMSQSAEAFRRIRAALTYINVDHGNNVLLVTSSMPSEGKTITALNLATTFSQAGEKVLLMDADLHKPRVTKALGINADYGLSELITNQVSHDEAVQQSGIPNLDVIAAGKRVETPAELVTAHKMAETINKLQTSYDRIIVDSPPIEIVSDALFIAAHCSGVVLVSKANTNTTRQLRNVQEELTKLDIPVLGVVLNFFNPLKREGLMTYAADTTYRESYQYAYTYGGKRASKKGYSHDYRIPYREQETNT